MRNTCLDRPTRRARVAYFWFVIVALAAATAGPYADGPPPGHTGGFGEPTCRQCHFDGPTDPRGVTLTLNAPERYAPGRRYGLTLVLRAEEMGRAGFQLSARFLRGPRAGAQAGRLDAPDGRVHVAADSTGVQFAQHTAAGSELPTPAEAMWAVEWTAPAEPGGGDVVFHVAANAANNDASEFGDRIVADSIVIPLDP